MPTSPHRASRRARQAWITRPGRIMSRGRADMGRTLSPLIEEPCARMSQGSRGLFAYDRPRRVGRPRHPGCEASAPLPSRLAPYPSGVGARLRGKPCHGSRQRQHPRSRGAPRSRGGLATSCARRASSVRRARGAWRRRRWHAPSRPKVPWRRKRRRSIDMPMRQPPSWRIAGKASPPSPLLWGLQQGRERWRGTGRRNGGASPVPVGG